MRKVGEREETVDLSSFFPYRSTVYQRHSVTWNVWGNGGTDPSIFNLAVVGDGSLAPPAPVTQETTPVSIVTCRDVLDSLEKRKISAPARYVASIHQSSSL
jgi:hypothetical protein